MTPQNPQPWSATAGNAARVVICSLLLPPLYIAPLLVINSWPVPLVVFGIIAFGAALALGSWSWPAIAPMPALSMAAYLWWTSAGEETSWQYDSVIWSASLMAAGVILSTSLVGVYLSKRHHLGMFAQSDESARAVTTAANRYDKTGSRRA